MGILKWDGTQVVVPAAGVTADLYGVWAGSGSVVAVGSAGTVARWNGTNWTATAQPAASGRTLRAVWGRGPSALWMVGDGGLLMAWNGASASAVSSGIVETLRAIWGSGASDVWAVGDGGRILHYDGSQWTLHAQGSALTARNLTAVYGASASQIYIAGEGGTLLRYDGRQFSTLQSGTQGVIHGLFVSREGDVLAVGAGASILRRRH